jgi:hypothetical protein
MDIAKIVRIGGYALVAAVALIPQIPMGGLILAIAGLVVGYYVSADNRKALFITVIVLASGAAGAVDAIPAIGGYITDILGSLEALLAAASVTCIVMAVKEHLTE